MEKWTQEQYAARLQEMKQEAHDKMWLYIEVNAKEFMNECEPGAKNLASCCKAMLDAMLEGVYIHFICKVFLITHHTIYKCHQMCLIEHQPEMVFIIF